MAHSEARPAVLPRRSVGGIVTIIAGAVGCQWEIPIELNRDRCHPARGKCITSNVTLGSPRMSGLRGKIEVNDEFPRQTRAAGPGRAALSSRQAWPALCHPG